MCTTTVFESPSPPGFLYKIIKTAVFVTFSSSVLWYLYDHLFCISSYGLCKFARTKEDLFFCLFFKTTQFKLNLFSSLNIHVKIQRIYKNT